MNDLLATFGLQSWKALFGALLLPPVPLIVLVLIGARLMFTRRLLAWSLILLSCIGLWLTSTLAAGKFMRATFFKLPPALNAGAIASLRREAAKGPPTAIVVLGAGRRLLSPEYGLSNLKPLTMERLRYGLWLSRETGLPVAYTGGVGHGAQPGTSEAEIAARIADREFGRPLRWTEDRSRDTLENGLFTVPMLQAAGIQRIVLVTHDFHEPRAIRDFRRGAERSGKPLQILPAPVGLTPRHPWRAVDFLPTGEGIQDTRLMLHEWLGFMLGA
jgi:uncharacterized SAM-binding protein YcdF (DUF218 family)